MRPLLAALIGFLTVSLLGLAAYWVTGEVDTTGQMEDAGSKRVVFQGFRTPAEVGMANRVRVSSNPEPQGVGGQGRTIEVVSMETREPVDSAMCVVRSREGDMLEVTRTNQRGIAFIQEPSLDAEVAVSADGFVAQVLSPGSVSHYLVALDRGRAITGVVRDYWGARATEGLLVIAREKSAEGISASSLFEGRTVAGREVLLARTGPGGEFDFTRCRTGATYYIGAVGPGVTTDWTRVDMSMNSSDTVQLVGGKIVKASIHLVDGQTGQRPFANPRLVGRGIGIVERFRGGPLAVSCHALDDRLFLAGVPGGPLHSSSTEHDEWMLLALTGFSEIEVCLAEVGVSLPGYSPEQVVIEYLPLEFDSDPVTIQMNALGNGWGALSISMPKWSSELDAPLDLRVALNSLGNSTVPSTWYEVEIAASQLEHLIEGIPAGEYRVAVVGMDGILDLTSHGRIEIQVQDGMTTAIDLNTNKSLEAVFSQQFLLSTGSVASYVGPFEGVLVFHGSGKTRETDFYFPGPPYTFVALPPGEYSLMTDPPVMFPPPANPREAGARFTVGPETAGVVHDLEVVF
jgi:hypothetical protein